MNDMADISGRSDAFIAAIASSCADVNSLSVLISEDHDWREAHPDQFFAAIAADLWADVPDGAAQTDFRARAEAAPWWATDVVECLKRILTDRPSWTLPILVEANGRGHWLGDPSKNRDQYFDWLDEQMQAMRASVEGRQPDGQ
jgi:hypothetical protein